MSDPLWLADVLREEGVKVVEMAGWKDRGHGDFGSVWGVLWHHMGVRGQGAHIIRDGVPGLDGPIANVHLALDGTATIVAAGVAWHAGAGAWPGLPTNNANNRLIGVEMAGNGIDEWPRECWDAAVRIGTAISRRLGNGADRNIAHKEWAGPSQGKWDPGNWEMKTFRSQIQARLTSAGEPMSAAEAKQVTDFVAGFCGPIGSDVKDIREQLCGTGQRDAGEYGGWEQLGGLTAIDALALIGQALGIPGFAAAAKGEGR